MRLGKLYSLFSVFFYWLTPLSTFASNQSLLDRITHKIASIKTLISRDTNKREKLQEGLAKIETRSGEMTKTLSGIEKKLNDQKMLLNTLKNNQKKYQAQLAAQQTLLNQQIQTAYMTGRQPYLKLLLNQQNSSETSRIMMYYHYINQSRVQAVIDAQQNLSRLQKNQEKIQAEYQTLQDLQAQQKNQQTQLSLAQTNRKQLLSTLNKHIQTRQQRLDTLIVNKRQLEKTLKRIAHRSVNFPAVNFPAANFSALDKRVSWPTRGHLLAIFGTKIEQSELRWGGVLIKAPKGQPVHAIANGKVIFAKWLSGYGLLLIINHGNDYMTLYGRNHVLYKKVGDIVHRGDLISTVGQTGGYQNPALYFAVRHNGKPVNPTLFISKEAL